MKRNGIRNGIYVVDNFAEAFPMKVVRLVITADSMRWARAASDSITGFATSVIACGVEAGIERTQLVSRVGQCVMTSPTIGLRHHEA